MVSRCVLCQSFLNYGAILYTYYDRLHYLVIIVDEIPYYKIYHLHLLDAYPLMINYGDHVHVLAELAVLMLHIF